MRRSKRIETLDQRPVNLDGYINEWPEMGFVAMTSPYDPKPSVKVANGRIVELDGKKREDFDFIDQFIADYAMNVERAEASMAVSSLEIARMIVDIHVSRKEILELVTGITPAKMTEVMNHLNVVELMMGMQKIRARRTPGNQAHITNLKDDPVQIAADAAEAAVRGFAEMETTVGIVRYAPFNAIAIMLGANVGRPGILTQCAVEEATELDLGMRGYTAYAETVSVYGTEDVFMDGDDTPWSKAFLASCYASRGVKMRFTSGTGSEVTPFAVITDEKTGIKYPLADYELLPKMAIIDADMCMDQPKGLTAASGIDALTHALEAYASIMATDYTDGLALKAMKNIFEYLPAAYENGPHDAKAREQMATASTMAGMAFANAFLGVCHSMAHKLGAYHHIPHGIANALLITDVMRFNAAEVPAKMGTFSQYAYPHCKERYVECANFLGITGKNDDEKFENFLKAIEELKDKVGIKKTIKDYGVDEKDFLATLDEMVENAFDDQCTGANPRYPLMSEIKAMYLKAYYGKEVNPEDIKTK